MARWAAGAAMLAVMTGLVVSGLVGSAGAADRGIPYRHHGVGHARDCGCCGCWYPEYVRRRQILYTYPSDPRYTLTSEPRYVRGSARIYLHNLF
jgi:hypothetical protein